VSAAPRFRFFGGKGGVGKTTSAAAAALAAAERGRRVLLVSTDPAHSLADAVDTKLSARPRRLAARAGTLLAVELDADRALERWIAARRRALRTIGDRGTYLDEEDVDRLLGLSLPGVDELIGLIELHRLAVGRSHDEVVVDTAPTGHTLRLLAMPETLARIAGVLGDMLAKHRFLGESLAGVHRGDAADALVAEIDAEARALHALLRDRERTSFTWVLLPEPVALAETLDGVRALDAAGIVVDEAKTVTRTRPPPKSSPPPRKASQPRNPRHRRHQSRKNQPPGASSVARRSRTPGQPIVISSTKRLRPNRCEGPEVSGIWMRFRMTWINGQRSAR